MATSSSTDISGVVDNVRDVLGKIQEKLLQQDPLLPVHLAAIHQTLIQYEELVHLLSEDEIAILVRGQKKHAGVELVKTAITKKTAPKAVPRGQSIADDL